MAKPPNSTASDVSLELGEATAESVRRRDEAGIEREVASRLSTAESNDLMTEIRGLREVVDHRFDAVVREQDMTRDWLQRMATTLERTTESLGRQVSIEQRQAATESDVSDLKLDLAGMNAELTSIKDSKNKTNLWLASIAAGVGAGVAMIAKKVLGLG